MTDLKNRVPLKIRARPGPNSDPACTGYDRQRDLPRLIPLYAQDMITPTRASQERLIALLRRALRQERVRGINADWTYDLGRHEGLLRAYRAEHEALRGSAPHPQAGVG